MTKKDILARLKEVESIYKESVTLRSGVESDFYCDIKKAYGHPDILNALAEEIGKRVPAETTTIAASGYGGLPLAAVVAAKCNKKFTLVRDKEKNHGRGGFLDGYVPTARDTVTIIDDVLTTGSSIRETHRVLLGTKATVTNAVVVIKRGEGELSIPYTYLFTIDELKK